MKTKTTPKIIFAGVVSLLLSQSVFAKVEYVPGEYVVKLKPSFFKSQSIESLSQNLKAQIKTRISGQNIVVVKRASIELVGSALKSLNANGMVQYAEPNFIYTINRTSNDPMYGQLWGLANIGQADPKGQTGVAGIDIGMERAWEIQTGNRNKIIAVIDTGVDYTHPDLVDNMWINEAEKNGQAGVDDDSNGVIDDVYGYNAVNNSGNPMDDQGHGSHCAGTIAARGDNGVGVVGVNWDARLMGVKFLDKNGSGTLENAIKAIDYATKMGASVMSNSWGGGGFSQALLDAIKRSNEAGAMFIAAAGNDNNNNDSKPTYPGSYQVSNVIAVAAIDNRGARASFSSYGKSTVHLGAPGVNVLSTTGGKYASYSGTSMATPHVAGVAALVWANEPNLTAAEVKTRLLTTARPMASMKGKTQTNGIVDAYAALTNTAPAPDLNDPSNWSQIALDVRSESPYKPNTNQEFAVKIEGVENVKEFALYFEKFDTESGYDTLTIFDSAGNKIQTLMGNLDDSYSVIIPGTTAKLVFKSDNSVQKSGWKITKAGYRLNQSTLGSNR